MLFADLALIFEKIEATSKRLEKTAILADLLHQLEPSEVRGVINLAMGQLAAPYERIQFSLAEKMLIRAISMSAMVSIEVATEQFGRIGDMGELAFELMSKGNKIAKKQTVGEVYDRIVHIARESGAGSQERKVRGLSDLIQNGTPVEAKYIVRVVNESLRLGFSEATMLDVFSTYVSGDKQYSERLEKVYQMRPDVALLGQEVVTRGIEETLSSANIVLGIPVIPALAQRLSTTEEMIDKMGSVYVEPKLDGTRVQIHFSRNEIGSTNNQALNLPAQAGYKQTLNSNNQTAMFEEEKPNFWVKTFTRNLDENTAQFPELLDIGHELNADSVILDAEAIGYDPKTGKLLPFQMTITRKRKHGVEAAQKSIPLKFFVFDIIYLDGQRLIDVPLFERREILKKVILGNRILTINEAIQTERAEEIRSYHQSQLDLGYEGVLVKKRDGLYEPGRQGYNWVKLKEVETATGKLSDTIDCVVMGYYLGRGKRSGFGIGAFLVGIRGETRILTIAKIGTGLSDEQFRDMHKRLEELKTSKPDVGYVVEKSLVPDIWVKPELVVEVAADEITVSPNHSAGYALRFPRLVKLRSDKSVEQATTLKEIKDIHEQS